MVSETNDVFTSNIEITKVIKTSPSCVKIRAWTSEAWPSFHIEPLAVVWSEI